MPYQLEETGTLTRTAEVTVPAEEFNKSVNKELRKLSGRVKIRGFRKGKIPLSVLKQRYGQSVMGDVIDDLIRSSLDEIIDEAGGVLHIGQPVVTQIPNGGGEPLAFRIDLELRPEIDPIGYLGAAVDKPAVEVTTEELEEELENLREEFAALEPIETRNTIKEGDTVTFDFKAIGEGEGVEQFQGEGAELEVGKGQAIPGIEEALDGAEFGSTVTATIDAPEEFPIEDLAGTSFEVEITIQSVKRRVLPELDDDFARDTGEAETMLELRQSVRQKIADAKEEQARQFAETDLIKRLLEQNPFELPPQFFEQQVENTVRRQLQQFQQQGMNIEQLGLDVDTLKDSVRDETAEQLRAEFLLMAIAEKEEIRVEDADIKEHFARQSRQMGLPADQIERYFRQDNERMRQVVANALLDKTVNKLLDEADVNEISEEEARERAQAQQEARQAAREKREAEKAEAAPKAEPKKAEKKAEPKKAEKKAEKTEEPKAEAAGYDAEAAAASFEEKTVDELKDYLRDNDLKVSGRKSELVERLVEAQIEP